MSVLRVHPVLPCLPKFVPFLCLFVNPNRFTGRFSINAFQSQLLLLLLHWVGKFIHIVQTVFVRAEKIPLLRAKNSHVLP
jgi:hypothetical protein